MLVGDEREGELGVSNGSYMQVGTDEKVCPYFMLIFLRGIGYSVSFISYASDKYVIVPSNMLLSKEKFG